MQYEHNMKSLVAFMPASLVARLFANGAKIPATGLVEVSPAIHVFTVPSHSVHVPL